MTSRRIPSSASTNQGPGKGDLIPCCSPLVDVDVKGAALLRLLLEYIDLHRFGTTQNVLRTFV